VSAHLARRGQRTEATPLTVSASGYKTKLELQYNARQEENADLKNTETWISQHFHWI
jgi:hypothetical protein